MLVELLKCGKFYPFVELVEWLWHVFIGVHSSLVWICKVISFVQRLAQRNSVLDLLISIWSAGQNVVGISLGRDSYDLSTLVQLFEFLEVVKCLVFDAPGVEAHPARFIWDFIQLLYVAEFLLADLIALIIEDFDTFDRWLAWQAQLIREQIVIRWAY